jgi:hypothetical protein
MLRSDDVQITLKARFDRFRKSRGVNVTSRYFLVTETIWSESSMMKRFMMLRFQVYKLLA